VGLVVYASTSSASAERVEGRGTEALARKQKVYSHRSTPSFTYTARPPTIVAATPPRSVHPSNGVFFDRDRMAAAETVTLISGARIERSAGAPSASDPPGTFRIRAGFTESSSTRRDSDTTPACTR